MSETLPERRSIPIQRAKGCPFDPPPELEELREKEPVCPVTMPDGTDGWLLTGYDDVYATLRNHQTFSSRGELRTSAIGTMLSARRPAGPGNMNPMDPPDHTRLRRKVQGKFTTKRVAQLSDAITRIVDERLDEMERVGPPVDLVETYSLPIPSLVICELLGVPYGDHAEFQSRSAALLKMGSTAEEYAAANQGLLHFVHELARHKRAQPTDDILSELAQDEELSLEETAALGMSLLVAGHETTANMITLSTFALLQHPDQLALLREDLAGRIDNAVEELLRYLTIPQYGLERAALEDVEVHLSPAAVTQGAPSVPVRPATVRLLSVTTPAPPPVPHLSRDSPPPNRQRFRPHSARWGRNPAPPWPVRKPRMVLGQRGRRAVRREGGGVGARTVQRAWRDSVAGWPAVLAGVRGWGVSGRRGPWWRTR